MKQVIGKMKNNPQILTKIQKAIILVADWRGFNFIKSKEGLLIIFSIKNGIGYKQYQFIKSYLSYYKTKNILFSELDFDNKTTKIFNLNPKDKFHIKIKINDLNDSTSKELIKSILDLSTTYYPQV
ncbi:MAG: hypothetical protein COA79_25140 [Planctomycetota bacterium]|nr:MAG: hypothetical protein COA79_25140 [Planctomycetota bacterium]